MTRAFHCLAGLLAGLMAAQAFAQANPAAVPAAAESPTRRVALVLGHAAYAEAPRLVNSARDADDVCAALRRLAFEADCHTDLGDREAMLAVLRTFVARLGPHTQAVLYYAGHAVQLQGENFLLPVQVRLRNGADVAAQSVRLDEILGLLRGSGSAFNFVVLDACRDDPFDTVAAARTGVSPASATTRGARGAAAGPTPRAKDGPADRTGAARFGLGVIRDAPAGSIVLYATGSGEPAFDGRGRNGPLTKHFLAHLETPGLPVEEFLKRVTAGVQADTQADLGRRQTPFVYSSFTGDFCFAGCRAVPLESELEQAREARDRLEQDLQRARRAPAAAPPPRIPPAL